MRPSELETLLREKLDPDATIHDMTDDGGYGLVRWSRPVSGRWNGIATEYIVHRWATYDTSGVERWPEGHFYNGGYHLDEESARADYRGRA